MTILGVRYEGFSALSFLGSPFEIQSGQEFVGPAGSASDFPPMLYSRILELFRWLFSSFPFQADILLSYHLFESPLGFEWPLV
jgi:hypothetical protein